MAEVVQVKADFSKLDALLKRIPADAQALTVQKAEDIVRDIRGHWSSHAPSAPGNPPAVRSGQLDASLDVQKYSTGKKIQVVILVQAEHGKFLEYGTKNMAARPFIRPAMKRAEKDFKSWWKRLFS